MPHWEAKADRQGRIRQRSKNQQRHTGFERDYKRDNCGYPEGGHAKVSQLTSIAAEPLSLYF